MLTIEDFTVMPEGLFVPLTGRVTRCPVCFRNGIETHGASGPLTFLHVQSSDVMCDGMLVEPQDCCTLLDGDIPWISSSLSAQN